VTLASKLKDHFPIPDKPHCAVSDEARWSAVEEKLGLQLPTDYKVFIGIYGTGFVGDFIILYNPFSTDKMVNLFHEMERIIKGERQLRSSSRIELPLYPEPGGLLPFARTFGGDNLFWQTQGEPDDWTLYLHEVRGPIHEEYAMTMSDFFIKLLRSHTKKIVVPRQDSIMRSYVLKMRPYKESAFRKVSWIMSGAINPKKPFVSLWVNLEKTFGNLKEELKRISQESNGVISQAALETLLKRRGLDLETDELIERLQYWQQEQFIELIGTSDAYLRVLNPEAE
jgi:hypothetical protein